MPGEWKRVVPLLLFLAAFGCSHGADLTRYRAQDNYGVEMARMNLWREAMFRFRRAVEIKPDDALAHNNLAVALEANGEFETAGREYREALKLDRSNTYIQKNYSRYTEFMSRSRKRPKGSAVPAETAAPSAKVPPSPPPLMSGPDPSTASPAAPPPVMPPDAQAPPVPPPSLPTPNPPGGAV